MMTAMLTAKNILAGTRRYDVWAVNQDAEYHEAGAAGEGADAMGTRAPFNMISGQKEGDGTRAAHALAGAVGPEGL